MRIPLEKCPDKNAVVEYTIQSVLVSANANGTETVSMCSAAMSGVDSGPESEIDFNELKDGISARKNSIREKRQRSNIKQASLESASDVLSNLQKE